MPTLGFLRRGNLAIISVATLLVALSLCPGYLLYRLLTRTIHSSIFETPLPAVADLRPISKIPTSRLKPRIEGRPYG